MDMEFINGIVEINIRVYGKKVNMILVVIEVILVVFILVVIIMKENMMD